MGIPFYYKHIVSTYKPILKDKIPTCNRLYIDFNSIIHQCAGAIVSKEKTYTHGDIIQSIIQETNQLIDKVQPSDLVFIGIDGVAPRAKMVQQRKRRYITAYKNELIKDACERFLLPPPPDWDSNIITPGTSFMKDLDKRLHDYFAHAKLPCSVIVSGSDERGEGEQKLFDHLRNNPTQRGCTTVINGLDADLIMLSLLSKEDSLYLQRDSQTYVDIAEFRRGISNHVDPEHPTEQLMYDYVFLCFLLGNDFVPNVPFLKIRNGAVDILLSMYKQTKEELSNANLIEYDADRDLYITNIEFLMRVMKRLANMERENMEYAIKQYNNTGNNFVPNIPEDCPKRLRKFLIELEQYPIKNKHPLSKGTTEQYDSWVTQYYHELFGSHDPNRIKAYCNRYIDGLTWVLNYYYNRKFDYFWYYSFHVAPLCDDIYKTLIECKKEDYDKKIATLQQNSSSIRLTPDLQLLSVIPKKSIDVLPKHLHAIMRDPNKACLHYYPEQFKLCTFMKKYLWECVPELPDIDFEHLNAVLLKQIQS